jgi:hypothetical protein
MAKAYCGRRLAVELQLDMWICLKCDAPAPVFGLSKPKSRFEPMFWRPETKRIDVFGQAPVCRVVHPDGVSGQPHSGPGFRLVYGLDDVFRSITRHGVNRIRGVALRCGSATPASITSACAAIPLCKPPCRDVFGQRIVNMGF